MYVCFHFFAFNQDFVPFNHSNSDWKKSLLTFMKISFVRTRGSHFEGRDAPLDTQIGKMSDGQHNCFTGTWAFKIWSAFEWSMSTNILTQSIHFDLVSRSIRAKIKRHKKDSLTKQGITLAIHAYCTLPLHLAHTARLVLYLCLSLGTSMRPKMLINH